VIRYLKPNLAEILVFALVIGLLVLGAYSRNRVWTDDVDLWMDVVKKSPNKARPYVNLGYAYLNAGAYDQALEWSERALQIDPRDAFAYYNLSAVYHKRGDLKQAILMGEKALEIDPTFNMAYYTMGGIYFEDKQYEKAEVAYKKFVQVYPYFPEVHNLLAVVYAAQRRFDKAAEALESELQVNPYQPLAHLNLGQLYWYEFKNREKALYHLKAALIIDPFLPDRKKIKGLVQRIEESPS
jgi:tetratricopeptide (TPR) repeat protein